MHFLAPAVAVHDDRGLAMHIFRRRAPFFLFRVLLSFVLIGAAGRGAADPGTPPEEIARARMLLEEIEQSFEPPGWQSPRIEGIRRAEQAPQKAYRLRMPPVWIADCRDAGGAKGYVMWEDAPGRRLVEFCLHGKARPRAGVGAIVEGVPNLQQFPVPGQGAGRVASGCVPTAGANLVGFWINRGLKNWAGLGGSMEKEGLQDVARRLRGRMRMMEIADEDGYTGDGIPLSGTIPAELENAIRGDAAAFGVRVTTVLEPYRSAQLQAEIGAGRPVLLSCVVRLPQKPHLSWGHEVTGVGWASIEGRGYAGVCDNFYPTEALGTTRWVEEKWMEQILSVRPETADFSTR